MVFCCFRNLGSPREEVPAKIAGQQEDKAAGNCTAGRGSSLSQAQAPSNHASASVPADQRQTAATGSPPQATSQQTSQDSVMRVVALLQELLGMTSERMQVSRIMGLLCQRLSVSWACLTALSADGEVFQHIGSAYLVDNKLGTCSFSSCRTNSGVAQCTPGGRGPPSRTSSTNSIVGASTVEVGMSDPHLLRGSDTSIEAAAMSKQPLKLSDPGTVVVAPLSQHAGSNCSAAGLSTSPSPLKHTFLQPALNGSSGLTVHGSDLQQRGSGHQPQSNPQQQQPYAELEPQAEGVAPVSSWPLDWQLMYREKGLRAFACLPVAATNGSGAIIGCLSFASCEPLDWSCQFWAASTRLITGWAAGAITTTRATARASFYARLFGATDLDGLARAFAYDMPVFLADGAGGPGTALPEVRLALVSSRLQHAVVFAAPLLQVSGRLGLPHLQGGPRGYSGAISGIGGAAGVGGLAGGVGYGNGFGAAAGLPPINSGVSMAGLVLSSAIGSGSDRFLPGMAGEVMPGGKLGAGAAAAHGHPHGGVSAVGGTAPGYDAMDCLVLGTALDLEDQTSGHSSSNNSVGGGGTGLRRGRLSASDNSKGAPTLHTAGRGANGSQLLPDAPPVECIKISTDSTLLMSVLEAGDIMIIKDALQYFGGGRMVARDLALNNTRPATAGTLVILPLVHRCRSLGCVYVFARNEFNLTFSRATWSDLAGMLSRAVFGQLVGKLRHEWYAVLSEDPESQQALQLRSGRNSVTGGGRGRVRRTTTGNSLCSNASSLRPSFELPSRSVEQQGGGGGPGLSREAAAAALAAAAEVLEYAEFILPDGDDGGAGSAAQAPPTALASPEGSKSTETAAAAGAAQPPAVPVRHKIPPDHAMVVEAEAAAVMEGEGTGGEADGAEATARCSVVEVAPAGGSFGAPSAGGSATDRLSPSPGSLSFKLPPNLGPAAHPEEQVLGPTGWGLASNVRIFPPPNPNQPQGHRQGHPEEPEQRPASPRQAECQHGEEDGQRQGQGRGKAQAEVSRDRSAGPSKESMATASVTWEIEPEVPAMAPVSEDAPTLALALQGQGSGVGCIPSDGSGGTAVAGTGSVSAAAGRPRLLSALQVAGSEGSAAAVQSSPRAAVRSVAVAAVASSAAAAAAVGAVDQEGDAEPEEVSGSSRELQGWPELVDILYDMHRTRNVSIYLAAYRGQAVAIKMMRSHMSMDGRPGHLESEALTIAAQQQLSTVRHANVLRVLMVYPLVYEVVASKAQRHGQTASGSSFVTHGGPGAGAGPGAGPGSGLPPHSYPSQHQLQQQQQQQHVLQQQQSGLGHLGPLHVQAHAMGDLLAGAGAAPLGTVSSGAVYLTAVLPRREKFKRGLALMLELFPSLSLREAIQKRMLLQQVDPLSGASDGAVGPGGHYHPVSSQTITSDAGCTAIATGSVNPCSGAGGIGVGMSSGGVMAGAPHHQHMPHPQLPFLPTLPEVVGAGAGGGGHDAHGLYGITNVDSSPGLAITGTSNSGGGNTGGFNSGPGGSCAMGFGANHLAPQPALLLSILTQIAAGMAALHSAGLAHGELRPENILLAMPPGGTSNTASGQHERTCTPRMSPTPTPRGGFPASAPPVGLAAAAANSVNCSSSGASGAAVSNVGGAAAGGCSVRGRSAAGSGLPLSGGAGASGGGPGGASTFEVDRLSKPERPHPGRPITADVIVKVKDAGMTVVGFSKASQMVRKLLQRNRSAVLPFLPPEVHRGERLGRSADVYMFGILMWELYTSCVAFSNLTGTPIKLLQTIIADGVRPLWPEGTPVWYQSLASRCWAGNPRQRPSFRRIGEKLAEVAASTAVGSGAAAGGGHRQGVTEAL